jgi:hypothetical protein
MMGGYGGMPMKNFNFPANQQPMMMQPQMGMQQLSMNPQMGNMNPQMGNMNPQMGNMNPQMGSNMGGNFRGPAPKFGQQN